VTKTSWRLLEYRSLHSAGQR